VPQKPGRGRGEVEKGKQQALVLFGAPGSGGDAGKRFKYEGEQSKAGGQNASRELTCRQQGRSRHGLRVGEGDSPIK